MPAWPAVIATVVLAVVSLWEQIASRSVNDDIVENAPPWYRVCCGATLVFGLVAAWQLYSSFAAVLIVNDNMSPAVNAVQTAIYDKGITSIPATGQVVLCEFPTYRALGRVIGQADDAGPNSLPNGIPPGQFLFALDSERLPPALVKQNQIVSPHVSRFSWPELLSRVE